MTPTLWLTIIICGILTFGIRVSMIAVQGRVTMPAWFTLALTFVPIAVLTAIIVPELVISNGALNLSLANPRLLAGILAVLVAWRTRSVWATIAVGMAALWALQFLLK